MLIYLFQSVFKTCKRLIPIEIRINLNDRTERKHVDTNKLSNK